MPALIDIRRRIRSVKNTQQITKAMKMVSAAKLRRAQEAMFAARPYARKMLEVLNSAGQPRRARRRIRCCRSAARERMLLVVVTADKGLCGGFNANIIRAGRALPASERSRAASSTLELVGRKGRDFFRRRQWPMRAEHVGVFQRPAATPSRRQLAARRSSRPSSSGEVDASTSLYNEFKSVIQQRVVVEQLLPIQRPLLEPEEPALDYIYEPAPREIFDAAAAEVRRDPDLARAAGVGRPPSTARAWRPWTRPPTTPAR